MGWQPSLGEILHVHLLLYLFERFYKPALTITLIVLVDALGDESQKAFWLSVLTAASLLVAACGPPLDQLYILKLGASQPGGTPPDGARPVLSTICIRIAAVIAAVAASVWCGALGAVAAIPTALFALPSISGSVLAFLGSPLLVRRRRLAVAAAMAASQVGVFALFGAAALRRGRPQDVFPGFIAAACAATLVGGVLLWRAAGPQLALAHTRVPRREVAAIIGASLVGWFGLRIDQFIALGASGENVGYLLVVRYLDAAWTIAAAFSGFIVFAGGTAARETRAAWFALAGIALGSGAFLVARFGFAQGAASWIVLLVGAVNVGLSMLLLARRGGTVVLAKNATVLASAAAWLYAGGQRGLVFSLALHLAGVIWSGMLLLQGVRQPEASRCET